MFIKSSNITILGTLLSMEHESKESCWITGETLHILGALMIQRGESIVFITDELMQRRC